MFQGEENDWKWNVTFTVTEGSVQQKDTMFAILDSINRTWHEQKNAELKKKKMNLHWDQGTLTHQLATNKTTRHKTSKTKGMWKT